MKRPSLGGSNTPSRGQLRASNQLDLPLGVPTRKPTPGPRMDRPGVPGPNVTYYVGDEVTYTPFFGRATLFVVGLKLSKEILGIARASKSHHKKVDHIYLGANRSCNLIDTREDDDPARLNARWQLLVSKLIKQGFYVSLEVSIEQIQDISEWEELTNSYFCPVIYWKCPNALNFCNGAFRIDDAKFNGPNDGVWTHPMMRWTDPAGMDFSPWRWFSKDTIVQRGDDDD